MLASAAEPHSCGRRCCVIHCVIARYCLPSCLRRCLMYGYPRHLPRCVEKQAPAINVHACAAPKASLVVPIGGGRRLAFARLAITLLHLPLRPLTRFLPWASVREGWAVACPCSISGAPGATYSGLFMRLAIAIGGTKAFRRAAAGRPACGAEEQAGACPWQRPRSHLLVFGGRCLVPPDG